ncbi:MAG: MFS transporter [Phenylobacterium sp.]|uniref:MFS transporter n=1 Tax=Phenylobacterium sp. TaxID=1871053 RepID=UPI001A4FE5D3|nr:MFS transporter [Phenylobacterium sp.]MBL8771409.1 MFS transporter [Phenylobacterium sp.]
MTAQAQAAPLRAAFSPLVVPLLGLAIFINYVDRGNLATAAPLLKTELSLSASEIGVLISAFFWTYTPGLVLAGWLADRVNAYMTLAAGLALWSLATLFTGFASGFAVLLVLRLVLGLGEASAFPCSSTIIARHVPASRLGAANAMTLLGVSLGPAVGVFFGGLLMAELGWRGIFILFGALSLAWVVPWFLTTRTLAAAPPPEDAADGPSLARIFAQRDLWGAALGHFAVNFGFYFIVSWMPLYLVQAHGYSLTHMATLGGVIYLVYAASAWGSGVISDRRIEAGGSPNAVRKFFFVATLLVASAGLAAAAVLPPTAAIASLFVVAVGLGAVGPHIFATGQTLAGPKAAGKWIGVQNAIANCAGITGPIITGIIVDRTGGFEGAFVVAAAVTLTGVVSWGLIVRRIAPLDWSAKA